MEGAGEGEQGVFRGLWKRKREEDCGDEGSGDNSEDALSNDHQRRQRLIN